MAWQRDRISIESYVVILYTQCIAQGLDSVGLPRRASIGSLLERYWNYAGTPLYSWSPPVILLDILWTSNGLRAPLATNVESLKSMLQAEAPF